MYSLLRGYLHPPVEEAEEVEVYYPRNAHDIYHASALLRRVLVADLVPYILDLAEYWTKCSKRRDDEIATIEFEPDWLEVPYLTLRLPPDTTHWLRKVEFSVESHDQGWTSHPQDQGTHRNSWTWFEVRVESNRRTYPVSDTMLRNMTRRLCTNVHGSNLYFTYTKSWSADAADEQERDWVKGLGAGYRVSIIPMAKYPGWTNHVKSAKIDVYTAAVR